MKKILLLGLILIAMTVTAQKKDPNKILDSVIKKFEKIEDYKVDVSIKLDVSFIKMPDTKAKIFFKQPDKVKVQSEGFAMLPKQGLNFSPAHLLKGDFSALYVRAEKIENHDTHVIKVIPNSDSTDIILSTLWIDKENSVIRKVETTGKKSGTLQIAMNYDDLKWGLPSEIKFSFNLGDMQIPTELPDNNQKSGDDKKQQQQKSQLKGTVIMTYTNYNINKGIPDKLFEEKEKK